jgi:predicted MFS family arabinose efflux permease
MMNVAVIIAGLCTFLQVYVTQPLLPAFRRIFAASELKVSMTVSAVTIGVAIAAPIVGLLADVIGRKRVIVPAIFAIAVPTLLSATATSLNQLIVWRFLQGLCIPGIIAVIMAYIAEEADPGTAGTITANYVTGTVVGGLAGRLVAGFCADHVGWKTAFIILGSTTILSGLLVWKWLPSSRHFTRSAHPLHSLHAMAQHLRNPRLVASYFVGFNVLFCLVGVFTYVNFYLAGAPFGLSTSALGMVFLVYALGIFVTPVAGILIDKLGHKRAFVISASFIATGACLTLIHALPMVIAGLALFSTGVFMCQSAASAHVALAAKHARSAATGLYSSFYYLGGSVGASVLGVTWHYGHWPACIGLVLLVQMIAAGVAYNYFGVDVEPADPEVEKSPPPPEFG